MKNEVNINIDLNVFAPVYIENKILKAKEEMLILYGGAGSGKSHFAVQKIIYRMLTEKNHKFLVVRKVFNTIKDSVYELFKQIIEAWGLSELFVFKKSPLEITCLNGNKIIFKGLDDPEKIKSITGITSIWVEEASELKNQEELNQLMSRVRGRHLKNYVQFILTFNPISEHHWIKKEYFDKVQPNTKILKTTYLDNPFLDDAYIRRIESFKEKDYYFYSVYALGNWGVLGNLVYSNYEVKDFDKESFDSFYYGVDFGFNDPNTLIKVAIKDEELFIVSEIYQTGILNSEFIPLIKKVVNENSLLICDSAYPANILEMKRAGLKATGAKKGQGSVKFGIDYIKRFKINIHPDCVNFVREIQSYKYKEDKDGKVYDEPVDAENHLMDALRYALEPLMLKHKAKGKAGKFSLF